MTYHREPPPLFNGEWSFQNFTKGGGCEIFCKNRRGLGGRGGEQPKGMDSVKWARMPDFFYCFEYKADLALL